MAELEGDDARLQPGLAFDLSEHPRPDFNDRWRSIAINTGKQHSSLQEEAGGSDYSTTYHLKPAPSAGTPSESPLQPKPCIDGPHTATVVGPPGEEITATNGAGSVSFPGTATARKTTSSCWIASPKAGRAPYERCVPRIGN
jgi:type VI secretion system secreted protein VgrG